VVTSGFKRRTGGSCRCQALARRVNKESIVKQLITFICIVILLSGCATKSKFVFEPLPEQQDKKRGAIIAALAPVTDNRDPENRIDKYYDGDPLKDVQTMLERELLSTALFDKVVSLPKPDAETKANLLIETSLKKMEWGVPDYESLQTKAFLVGLFTGLIGGAIYANTDTEVYGDSSIQMKVIEQPAGKVILEKSYEAHHEETVKKMHCDTPPTRIDMAGKSLKKAFQAMNADLLGLLGGQNIDVVGVQTGLVNN